MRSEHQKSSSEFLLLDVTVRGCWFHISRLTADEFSKRLTCSHTFSEKKGRGGLSDWNRSLSTKAMCIFAASTENWSGASSRSSNPPNFDWIIGRNAMTHVAAASASGGEILHNLPNCRCDFCQITEQERRSFAGRPSTRHTFYLFFYAFLRVERPCPAPPAEMSHTTYILEHNMQ